MLLLRDIYRIEISLYEAVRIDGAGKFAQFGDDAIYDFCNYTCTPRTVIENFNNFGIFYFL